MKRAVVILMMLTLALSACGKSQDVGGDLGCTDAKTGKKITCELASASPTIKKTTTRKPTASPTKTKPPTAKPAPGYVGRTSKIIIRDTAHQYEAYDSKGNPTGSSALVVVVGDTILFQNLDVDTARGHSVTADNDAFDTGLVKPKGSATIKITMKPGDYKYHDSNIGYIIGGPIRVIAAPK